ncbi:MAG: bestrophin family ion channel [Candidatus Kapabacteria bacterium]|nr:bestrophin family ion channel [Candidatus Kapabacteria bacterium]
MLISKRITLESVWLFGGKNIVRTFALSAFVVALYQFLDLHILAIPFLPIATIGTAVAFYIGFKNNQAYDRLWEARRLWGGITNTSRTLAASVISLVEDKQKQRAFLNRHIAYVNILRLQLRKTIPWATNREDYHRRYVSASEEVQEFDTAIEALFQHLDKVEIYEKVKHKGNIASYTLHVQFNVITKMKREGILDEYEHSDITKLLGELYNLQGGCERIKTTPLFRQYSLFSRIFVQLFILLLPFALLTEMAKIGEHGVWLVVPFTVLISWVFMTMEQIGEASENPFDNGSTDTPMSTICRNIEIDILEMLDETTLPDRVEPFNDVLL